MTGSDHDALWISLIQFNDVAMDAASRVHILRKIMSVISAIASSNRIPFIIVSPFYSFQWLFRYIAGHKIHC